MISLCNGAFPYVPVSSYSQRLEHRFLGKGRLSVESDIDLSLSLFLTNQFYSLDYRLKSDQCRKGPLLESVGRLCPSAYWKCGLFQRKPGIVLSHLTHCFQTQLFFTRIYKGYLTCDDRSYTLFSPSHMSIGLDFFPICSHRQ